MEIQTIHLSSMMRMVTGVEDSKDNCEETPASEEVDENGCTLSQKDSDKDGVTDDLDECLETPADTKVDAKGCEVVLGTTTATAIALQLAPLYV